MKFVFFVHYFPPLNSTGGKRVEAFSKYLGRAGHEVVIVSTRKSSMDGPLTEVVPASVRLYELDSLGRVRRSRMRSEGSVGGKTGASTTIHWTRRVKQRLATRLGQLPDPRIPFALALASPLLNREVRDELRSADLFVSSFPPWPVHWAARIAKRRWNKPWIIDYRDQFSGNHIMGGGPMADRLEASVDRWLVSKADVVTVISEPMRQYYAQYHPRVRTIENGFDGEVFEAARERLASRATTPREDNRVFVVRYMGTITRDRIPVRLFDALLNALKGPAASTPAVVFEFYGDSRLLQSSVRRDYPALEPLLRFLPAIPYLDSIENMLTADALLFVETSGRDSLSAQGVLTTKLFEYLAVGKPILAEIDPESLAASYITRVSDDHVVSLDGRDLLEGIRKLQARPQLSIDSRFVASLSRSAKTDQLQLLARELLGIGR